METIANSQVQCGFCFCPVGSSCCCYSAYQSQELIPCQNKHSDFRLGSCRVFAERMRSPRNSFASSDSLECIRMRYPHGEQWKAKPREHKDGQIPSTLSLSSLQLPRKFCRCVERKTPSMQLSAMIEDGEDSLWVARCDETLTKYSEGHPAGGGKVLPGWLKRNGSGVQSNSSQCRSYPTRPTSQTRSRAGFV